MQQARKITAQIRAVLGGAVPPLPLQSLAEEFARLREEAARRLEACAGMLAKGSEHSALELAEAQPPLLDLVAELGFTEAPQWEALCASHDLPAGPPLDARTVAALDAVYAKGLSPNSSLYQDYRAAVTARDDARALQIIRTITRLNPADANAAAELDRLNNKFMLAKLEALKRALSAGEDGTAAGLVDELEEFTSAEKLGARPDYTRGLAVRKRVRLAEAVERLPALLAELEALRQSGEWVRAAEGLATLDEQECDLGLAFAPEQAARRDSIRAFVEERRADAAEQHRFLQAVERLRVAGEQAATRVAGRSTLSLEEASELRAKFDQLQHEVTQYRRTIPAAAQGSIEASRAAVHGALSRLRTRFAMRRLATAVAVILVVGLPFAWFGRKAMIKSYRERLAEFQEKGQALSARDLIERIHTRDFLRVGSDPDLQAAMAAGGRWVETQEELARQAEAEIASLEATQPADTRASEVFGRLNAVDELTGKLAPDMAPPLRERTAAVRRRYDDHFAQLREQGLEKWRATFNQVETLLKPAGFEMPPDDAAAVVAKAAPLVEELAKGVNHPVPALRPDAATIEAFQALSSKLDELRGELSKLSAAQAALQRAGSLEEYRAALEGYTAVHFSQTTLAQPALRGLPAADDIPARLLMDGDRAAWQTVKSDVLRGAVMAPPDVKRDELEVLLMLRDDPNLKDVWQWNLVGKGGTRTGYSRGPLREYNVGGEKRYDGMLWQPRETDLTPVYLSVKLPTPDGALKVGSTRLSEASQLLEGLKLQEFTDADGARWTRPALEAMQGLLRAPSNSPTARAILLQQLSALVALRPYEWGAHFSPTYRQDLERLRSLCGGRRLGTFEWMLPATTEKLGPKLAEFFQQISSHEYFNEARRVRDAALALRDAGVRYAGFVDQEGKVRLVQDARSASELWSFDEKQPRLLRVNQGKENAGLGSQVEKCAPFTPLFHVPLDRAELLERLNLSIPGIPFLKPA